MKTYSIHPLLAVVPPLNKKREALLAIDIKKNGLREPITLLKEQILDGRSRYYICRKLGIKLRFKQLKDQDPRTFILSQNLSRSHLTKKTQKVIQLVFEDMNRGTIHSGFKWSDLRLYKKCRIIE